MQSQQERIAEVFQRVDATLQTAMHGYEDVVSREKSRRMTGLRNLIVFGRSVTFVLQNLRSVLNDGEFDDWYGPQQDQLKAEPLMRFFVDLRNDLEKQGKLAVSVRAHVTSISSRDIDRFYRPPGAEAFFIGDQFGGSGWVVRLPGGSEERYYVDLPSSWGEVTQHFSNLPASIEKDFPGQSVDDLSLKYLNRLSEIVQMARKKFLPIVSGAEGKRHSHLRVVK